MMKISTSFRRRRQRPLRTTLLRRKNQAGSRTRMKTRTRPAATAARAFVASSRKFSLRSLNSWHKMPLTQCNVSIRHVFSNETPAGATHFSRAFVSSSSSATAASRSNSAMPRTCLALVGGCNAGKSSLLNLLVQSPVSLVHSTRGTTADIKSTLMELHGGIGPIKLMDTPGVDEPGSLGDLKRELVATAIKVADVIIIVADPFDKEQTVHVVPNVLKSIHEENDRRTQIEAASAKERSPNSQLHTGLQPMPLIVWNMRSEYVQDLEEAGSSGEILLDSLEEEIQVRFESSVISARETNALAKDWKFTMPNSLAVDLQLSSARDRIVGFLDRNVAPRGHAVRLLPSYLYEHGEDEAARTVFLNIPMDIQTPRFRLLRPQAMVQEELLREFHSVFAYRMNLPNGRSEDQAVRKAEERRFRGALEKIQGTTQLLMTDSQAIDLIAPWTLDENTGEPLIPITTFSIAMIRFLSGGRLDFFVDGLRHLDKWHQHVRDFQEMPDGKPLRVLVVEACSHTRIADEKVCADIGLVQLPRLLKDTLGENNVKFDFLFGKHVMVDPDDYDFVVHCGGCMLSQQAMDARVADLHAAGVPATNYGLLLSWAQNKDTLRRVLEPWGIDYYYASK